MFWQKPLRHPLNKELHLLYEPRYRGASINVEDGPMVMQYMAALMETFNRHQRQYSKIFSVMVSLYFPGDWRDWKRQGKDYFCRFMDSLNAKLDAHNNRKKKQSDSRSNQVRFCRVYEWGPDRGIHIHAVLFFNGHVFWRLGDFESTRENLKHRITASWASALGMLPDKVRYERLIHISDGDGYFLERGADDFRDNVGDMFYHYSYICKAYSKRFDLPVKTFSRSRG